MTRVQPKCPSCGRLLAPIAALDVATMHVHRTCRGARCREIWRLKIEPDRLGGARLHWIEFQFLGRRSP